MADATPANRTLLFKSPREFKASGQCDYAHTDPSIFSSKKISSTSLPHLGRHMMVRNLDEVRRMPDVIEALRTSTPPHSPSTGGTGANSFAEPQSPPEGGTELAATYHHLPPLVDHDDWVETQRWEEGRASSTSCTQPCAQSLWSWPMEVLYQRYHVVVALDMSRATFEVSRNGSPFVDRIPFAIDSILKTISLTLETRKVEVCSTKAWAKAYLPQGKYEEISEMLWDPRIVVSIVFVNAPHRMSALIHQGSAPKHSSDHHTSNIEEDDEMYGKLPSQQTAEDRSDGRANRVAASPSIVARKFPSFTSGPYRTAGGPPLSTSPLTEPHCTALQDDDPPSKKQVPFLDISAFPFGVLDDSSDYSVERTFPLVMQCPAEDIADDATFLPRLKRLIRDFENLYRMELSESGDHDHWPEVNIDETIERSLRFVPFDDEYCHSVTIVSNFAVCGCSETIALQESQVIRKNVILACMSLNRFIPWESPHLTPLGHFLIASGGFGLHVDQWVGLSAEELITDWCQRFEGARCLAQQMFVQLISKFPVVSPGVSFRIESLMPPIKRQPYLIEAQLEAFRKDPASTTMVATSELLIPSLSNSQVLRMLATARLNEGWSVVMDVHPEVNSAHLYARLDHFLHKGSLTVYYDALINSPKLHRKLKVQGTPALVRQLCSVQLEDRLTVPTTTGHASRNWHTYLALLRGLLDGWMRADDDQLQLYSPTSIVRGPVAKQPNIVAGAIALMSRLQGCTAEWLNRFCVDSMVCVLSYASPCARIIDNLFGGASVDGGQKAFKSGLSKRPNDPLLSYLNTVVVHALKPLGFSVIQEAASCHTPSAYNAKHCIMYRTAAAGEGNDDAAERCSLDVIQAFVIDESSNGADLVAATCEIRLSFSHRSPTERATIQADICQALGEFLAHSPGSIVLHMIPLSSSCVARRATCMIKHDLLSKWSDPSSASSAAQAPSRAATLRSSKPKRLSRSSHSSSSHNKHTVQYAAQRVFVLGAHGSELFLMKGTTSMRWSFGAFVRRSTNLVSSTALMLLGMRREGAGFHVLHAHAGGKRVLLRRCVELPLGKNQRNETIDVHDVLETDLTEGRWDLRIVRHISHYDRIMATLGPQGVAALTQDIRQDHQVLSTLLSLQEALTHPFHDKDATVRTMWTTPQAAADVTDFLKMGGQCEVVSTLESLVPHLRADCFKVIELQPPPCAGDVGGWELERGVHHVATNLGDESVSLRSLSTLHPGVLELLRGSREVSDKSHMAQVTRLSPRIGAPLLTLLVSICPNERPPPQQSVQDGAHPTRLLIGTVDTCSVLHGLLSADATFTFSSQFEVLDVNSMRVRLQPTPVAEDSLLLSSTEALIRAYATALYTRSLHREVLLRCSRRLDAPGTPTAAHSSVVMSGSSTFPVGGLGSPADAVVQLLQMPAGTEGQQGPLPPIPCGELKSYFSSMIAYASAVDITFLAKLQGLGLLEDSSVVNLICDAVQRRQGSLRCMCSTAVDLEGALYAFDPRYAKQETQASPTGEIDIPIGSWDGASAHSRQSVGIVKDIGPIEADQVGCLVRLLLHKQYNDPNTPDELEWVGSKRAAASESNKCIPVKITLTFIAVTLPDALFDFTRNRFRPSGHMLRGILRTTLENGGAVPIEVATATKASADFGMRSPTACVSGMDTFFRSDVSPAAAAVIHAGSIPLGRLPEVLSTPLESVADSIAAYLGDCALEVSHRSSQPFMDARRVMLPQDDADRCASIEENPLTLDVATTSWTTAASSFDALECSGTANSFVQFDNKDILRRVLGVAAMEELCRDVICPAFASTKSKHRREEFAVEFTRTARHGDVVDPFAATHQVFSQVLLEEGMCMLPVSDASYLLIPAPSLFSKGIFMLVKLERRHNLHIDTVSVLCFEAQDTMRPPAPNAIAPGCNVLVRDGCAEVRRLISQKVAQVSQIHLLREVRDRERAPEELLPLLWGDQFLSTVPDPVVLEANLRKATFLCPGKTVAEIPIYYRLQHQAKSILAKIVGNSHKMHLYRIYDREQCFVVMDDAAEDAFHVIRLVFIKTGTLVPSPTQFPLPINDRVDVCSVLAVQVFSAHPNAQVSHAIEALQDFCYLLALQELQTRLKISMEKDLHAHDWAFLRYDKREPLTLPMVAGGQPWHPAIRDLAKWFLLRNMNECKFRFFAARDTVMHTNHPNSFLTHYQIHRESMVDVAAAESNNGSSQHAPSDVGMAEDALCPDDELRFVKREEASTDVLLSCGIHFHTESNKIIVDVYSTKLPNSGISSHAERIASMTRALRQCLSDTALHVNFFLASQRTTRGASFTPKRRPLHVRHAVGLADNLISMAQDIRVHELSILKKRSYDLRHVNSVHLGALLERIVGLLQDFGPHLLTTTNGPTSVVSGFPWSWMEACQNQYHADKEHYFILCGFQLIEDIKPTGESTLFTQPTGSSSSDPPTCAVPPTRAHAAAHPSFHLDTTTNVEVIRASLLQTDLPALSSSPASSSSFHNSALYDKPKIVFHINLREGAEVVAFNMKDSETLLNLISVVVQEMCRKSSIHRDVLLQSLGYDVPTAFNEQELARMCCGDQRNVHEPQALNIIGEVLHRSAVMVRFPRHVVPAAPSAPTINLEEAFMIVVVGLSNRGTIVNHVFPYDGAVKTLFDDGPMWSIEQCKEAVDQLVALGVFVRDASPLFGLQTDTASHTYAYAKDQALRNFRIAVPHSFGVPHTSLVANVYHRHLQRAHIIVEAKNARAKVADGVLKFERCWAARATCSKATFVRHIIQLQLKSKQVKGLRVPDFTLRSEGLSPQDLILDAAVPAMTTDRQKVYCHRVDEMLRQYVNYLLGVFGDAVHVVEVDPSVPDFSLDPDIATRLRCRYGKVADPDAESGYITFTPRLFFVVMTVSDAMAAVRAHRQQTSSSASSGAQARGEQTTTDPANQQQTQDSTYDTSSGFFVVEIGFQVVNYALDYYIIGGTGTILHSDVNLAATLLKQRFLFSSVVYDLGVQRLVQQVRQPSQTLSGEQPVAIAVKNLVKYYPSPPGYSINYVHAFPVTEPTILGLRHLLVATTGGAPHTVPAQVIVAPPNSLRRESTQDLYSVVGVLSWEAKPKLYVIIVTERATMTHRVARRDMAPMLSQARQMLIQQLLDATVDLRVRDTWKKLWAVAPPSPGTLVPQLCSDDFMLLQQHSCIVDCTSKFLFDGCDADGNTPLLSWSAIERQLGASAAGQQRCGVILRLVEQSSSVDNDGGCVFASQHLARNDTGSAGESDECEILTSACLFAKDLPDGTCTLRLQVWRPDDVQLPSGVDIAEVADVEAQLLEALSRLVVSAMWNDTFSSLER